jgi:SAM-dependent methyltransferase
VSAAFPQYLLDGLDRATFAELCRSADVQLESKRKRDHTLKHDDLDVWIARAWKDARHLKLDHEPPLDILDIGTGPGYFPYVCQRLGHRAIGLDQPGFFPFWERLHEWLGVNRVVHHAIRPKEKLPSGLGRFDIVTAYRCQFNYNPNEKRLWNLDEWNFFLDDLRDNVLKPGGRFVLRLTKQEDKGKAGLRRDNPLLTDWFRERGAQERKSLLVFAPLK